MKTQIDRNRITKRIGTILAVSFAIITVITLLTSGQADRLALAMATIFLAMIPAAVEKLFHCRVCLPIYLFALVYAVGPMLGHCWYWYYTLPGWDKVLHISGGVMFAIIGAFLFDRIAKGKQAPAVNALFALCFSIAIAAIWEFIEFGADQLLGMDMQNDTVITHITSYLLGDMLGHTHSIENIQSVAINGEALNIGGYLDVGLVDSMLDMLLESVGALVTCLLLLLDKGRHSLITVEQKENR